MLSKVLVFVLIVGIASAAVSREPLPEIPEGFDGKEGCYIEEVEDVIPFGCSISPIGFCYQIKCSENEILRLGCGVIGNANPKCYLTDEDLSKPYPACCKQLQCDADDA